VFGNAREAFTFEAKIEQSPSGKIIATEVGQAHNQRARAEAELGPSGYTVRGTIVTHLSEVRDDALSGLGQIKVIGKDAVNALWERVRVHLSNYRTSWSLDDPSIRVRAADALRPRLPRTGWLVRALDTGSPFVSPASLIGEWGQI
jgi:hypothetical protein